MYCIKMRKVVENLWYSYLLFRCCIIVIPIYIILIFSGCYVISNNLEVPTVIRTLYEFALLVFSAAIVFIIVLILATFGNDSNRLSMTDYDYDSEMLQSTNETAFDDISNNDENLINSLERATDQIELFFEHCNDFVVDLVPIEDRYGNRNINYDSPPSYEDAIRSGKQTT